MEGINTAETNRAAFCTDKQRSGGGEAEMARRDTVAPLQVHYHLTEGLKCHKEIGGGICSGGYFSSTAPRTDLKKGSASRCFLLLSFYVPAYEDDRDDV